jgi:transglutaminase-like putative cysteine protease
MPEDLKVFLQPTPIIESEHPEVVAFAKKHAAEGQGAIETAVRLYYAVRDGIRYDPYTVAVTVEGLKASQTLRTGRGWCVAKSVLLAACCRKFGIPAQLGFADVRNHLSTARIREAMGTDMFYWHGYTSIYLDGKWVKATSAFNLELCEKFGLLPLEFDGREDSLYQPFDREGKRHMEYVRQRGEFPDVPLDDMRATFEEHYFRRGSAEWEGLLVGGDEDADFDREVESETSN